MAQPQSITDLKDTGVTVAPEDTINEILPFCAQGQEGRDLLSQAEYAVDMQRNVGHQPGIARAKLANKQARQASHVVAGLAQFLARRYAPGVVDDGDLDKVEAALVAAVRALEPRHDASFALCESAAEEPVKTLEIEGLDLVPGSKVYLRFSEVNTAVNPKISINGGNAEPLLWEGVAPEVGDLAAGQVYEVIYTGSAWQIMAGMARTRICQTAWFEDTLSRPGFVPLNGSVVESFAESWPQAYAYLQTAHGQARCFSSLAERQAAHVAIWHTLASGATVGWQGVGGVSKFFYDADADTLYMPDLSGMFRAMAGDGVIAPSMAEVMGDGMRRITGGTGVALQTDRIEGAWVDPVGAFYMPSKHLTLRFGTGQNEISASLGMDSSRVVPTGAANIPRSWGSLACAYFGQQTHS